MGGRFAALWWQGCLEQVILSCLSWLETALWAPLGPILLQSHWLSALCSLPRGWGNPPEPLSTAPRRWPLPSAVALAALQAPQTVSIEDCPWGVESTPFSMYENIACRAQSPLHPPALFTVKELTQPFQTPLQESERPLCLTASQVLFLLCDMPIVFRFP